MESLYSNLERILVERGKAQLLAANKGTEVEYRVEFVYTDIFCHSGMHPRLCTRDSGLCYCYNTPTSCKMLSSHFYFPVLVVNDRTAVNQLLFSRKSIFFTRMHRWNDYKREAGTCNCTVCREISPQAFLNYRWKQSIYCIAIFRKDIRR